MRRRAERITMTAIRRLAREIVEKFQPDKIILFGSYAYGTPNRYSDVDLLVVMPARNEISQEIRILSALEYPFPIDLMVRTPERLRWRLAAGDWFLKEVVTKGRVLYEQTDGRMGPQGRSRPASRATTRPRRTSAK